MYTSYYYLGDIVEMGWGILVDIIYLKYLSKVFIKFDCIQPSINRKEQYWIDSQVLPSITRLIVSK